MNWQNVQAIEPLDPAAQAIFVEARTGSSRRDYLQHSLQQARDKGSITWLLPCDMEIDGPWTGLKDLFEQLIPQFQTHCPDVMVKHDYELANILPALRRTLAVRNPTLTDIALEHEKVRNYPADRALRIIHGLIDVLDTWRQHSSDHPWVIACDDYDRAGVFVQRFFAELLRRRGQSLNITLILGIDPKHSEATRKQFLPHLIGHTVKLNPPHEIAAPLNKQEMARRAQNLLQQVGDDRIEREIQLPKIIRYWLLSDQPEQALRHRITIFAIYTKHSLYEDALVYGEAALAQLEHCSPENLDSRWHIVSRLYFCYAGLRRSEEALNVIQDFMTKTRDHEHLMYCCYFISMLYARLLPQRDLSKAEDYLERGLEELAQANLPEYVRVFQTVFNRNGLALIRHFQGRYQEAIELCMSGYAQLDAHLAPDEHRLHRSVLLYNIAQVYAVTELFPEAIKHFSMAMEMDPNYSEYYNERGNIYLVLEQLEEALNDYLIAIELSPPYPEVWTNLGQCYRYMARIEEAIEAYSRALDLDPYQSVALAGRGEAFEMLEQPAVALLDYSASLVINPKQPVTLANRAILYYRAGQIHLALDDVNKAIELAPDMVDLYQNRAIALTDLGRYKEAYQDLEYYLSLNPEADDRSEVEERLVILRNAQLGIAELPQSAYAVEQ